MNRWKRCFSLSLGPLPTTSALAENVSFTAVFNVARTVDVCLGGGRTASFHLPLRSLQLITAKFMRFRHDLLPKKTLRKYSICCARSLHLAHVGYRFVRSKQKDETWALENIFNLGWQKRTSSTCEFGTFCQFWTWLSKPGPLFSQPVLWSDLD